MSSNLSRISRQFRRRTWVLFGIVSLVLLGSTLFVRIRIVVLQPDLGDVSGFIGGVTQLLLVVATLFSGMMAYFSDGSDTGPATKIEVEGDYYDITFPSGEQPDRSGVRDAVSRSSEGEGSEQTGEDGTDDTQEGTEPEADDQS